VNGFDNLFAMEIDPSGSIQEMIEQCLFIFVLPLCGMFDLGMLFAYWFPSNTADENGGGGAMGSMMQDLAFAIPGVDEAMGFAEIMK
jgi:anion-transporting  ArsA/GET3 family ATPase